LCVSKLLCCVSGHVVCYGRSGEKTPLGTLGIIKSFVRGVWCDPKVPARGPGLFEKYRFSLHRLYDLRLGADYRLDDIKEREAIWAIETTKEIMQTIKGR